MTESGSPPTVEWEEPDPRGPAPGVEFAPHGERLLAYLVDSVILFAIAAVLLIGIGVQFLEWAAGASGGAIVEVSAGALVATLLLLMLVVLLIFLYFPFFWARGGQTPGMRLFGLRVVADRDGGRIGWGTALLRTLGMYVSSAVLYLGFIWILVDKRRRGFHDLIAGTVVVKRS